MGTRCHHHFRQGPSMTSGSTPVLSSTQGGLDVPDRQQHRLAGLASKQCQIRGVSDRDADMDKCPMFASWSHKGARITGSTRSDEHIAGKSELAHYRLYHTPSNPGHYAMPQHLQANKQPALRKAHIRSPLSSASTNASHRNPWPQNPISSTQPPHSSVTRPGAHIHHGL